MIKNTTFDQSKAMPSPKDSLSTTYSTRLLAALPSKVYIALYEIYGSDKEARKQINELARALVLDFFFNNLQGDRFLSQDEKEKLEPFREASKIELSDLDWDALEKDFKAIGQLNGEHDPYSPAYIINSIEDLEGLEDLKLAVDAA